MRGPGAASSRPGTLQGALAGAAGSGVGLTFLDARERETFLPFREVHRRAAGVACALHTLGVRPGDRVALVLPTAPSFMDAFFGVLLAGGIPVPLYPPLRLGRLPEFHARTARMLEVVGARLVLTEPKLGRLLGVPVERARPVLGCLDVTELDASRGWEAPERDARPDDVALIQFSSGTTHDPKPVALSHTAILANLAAIDSLLPDRGPGPPVGVSWLPLYHDMGLIGALLMAVYHPAPLTLIPPELFLARPALWLRAISRHRATVSPAPNFAFALATRRIRAEELGGVDLSTWRLAPIGAEPVTPHVLRRFTDRFARWGFDPRALTPVYGLSEATLAVTFSAPERPFESLAVDPVALARFGEIREGARELASVGTPLPGVEVEIRDDGGRVLPERAVGRICVRGASVMTGYFDDSAATAEALRDGWLDTGDLGFVARGRLYVCGRSKDLVILRGANHAPQEFEECLDGMDGLRAGCAVAIGFVPPGSDGEELAILAELPGGESADRRLTDDIRARVLERTGVRPHVVLLLVAGTLPRTSSGKLRRAEARRQFLAGALAPPLEVSAVRLAVEILRSATAFARANRPREGGRRGREVGDGPS